MEVTYIWPPWLSESYHPRFAALADRGRAAMAAHAAGGRAELPRVAAGGYRFA
jgi:hypothetical protein